MSERVNLRGNQGPLLNIAVWVTLVAVILATGMKFYVKTIRAGQLYVDDLFIGISTLSVIALCVTVAEQVHYGLGRDFNSLSPSEINLFFLYSYLTSAFYVITTFISKLAAFSFFVCLSKPGVTAWIPRMLMSFVGVWTAIAIFVVSFQCSMPKTWDLTQGPAHCTRQSPFWIVHGVMDLLTQIAAAFLPVYLLWGIQAKRSKKLFSMFAFSFNSFTFPLIVLRLTYLNDLYLLPSPNPTTSSFRLFLVTALHANMSIIFATIPFSKPIIDSLAVGVISNDISTGLRWDQRIASAGHVSGRSGERSGSSIYGWRKLPGIGASSGKSDSRGIISAEQGLSFQMDDGAFSAQSRSSETKVTVVGGPRAI